MKKHVALLLAIIGLAQAPAHAQPFPSKPIKFVIAFGPGSASDSLARILGQDLSQSLGQPVVVVHKPGADGALAGIEVQRSAPDGYTFLFGTNSPLGVVPNIRKEPPYDVLRDFTPVSFLGENTLFFVAHPSLPAKSIAELVAYAKANPNKLNYATGNTFAITATAHFAKSNGIQMEPIPYKSEPDAITDLLSGRVQLIIATATTVTPHVKAGNLRALAAMLPKRSPLLPEVPAYSETGQPAFPITAWFALVAPANLPAEIVQRMNKAVADSLAKAAVRQPMEAQGFMPRSSTPQELAIYMKDQLEVWKNALTLAGVEKQ